MSTADFGQVEESKPDERHGARGCARRAASKAGAASRNISGGVKSQVYPVFHRAERQHDVFPPGGVVSRGLR